MGPTTHTFDRVFGSDSLTKQVYEEGAKEIALSALGGINSSIFAYGQTGSGKTYTMTGITEYAIADVYNYMDMHKEREFVLKFSGMEIYNEAVRDLLRSDSAPLRLLDDPEKGTVVERLAEITLKDRNHLHALLSICEAERKVGETFLNETSSRSHQILRLTIESSAREYERSENASILVSQMHFVDLAGSERVSQTLSAGARLKEGCHISLLTLGTVIRKLSKGRHGHIPFRDSKLTRILQNSLGGNARTAMICTMSPARSHVDQSRNTLLFGSCAQEVTTNPKVNVWMSNKALVKQPQREMVGRMESEFNKSLAPNFITYDVVSIMKEKDLRIAKMNQEIKELTRQYELAQHNWVESIQQSTGDEQVLRMDECPIFHSSQLANPCFLDLVPRTHSFSKDFGRPSARSFNKQYPQQFAENPEDNFLLDENLDQDNFLLDENPEDNFLLDVGTVGPDPYECLDWNAQMADSKSEDDCKEVRCIEVEELRMDRKVEAPLSLPGPEKKIGHLPLREVMNEDAVTSPTKGPTEATNGDVATSLMKVSKEAMNEDAVSSPQKRSKKVMHEEAVSFPENRAQDLSDVNAEYVYDDLKQRIQSMQNAISCLISFSPSEEAPRYSDAYMFRSRRPTLVRSRSCGAVLVTIPPTGFEDFPRSPERPQKINSAPRFSVNDEYFSRKDSQKSLKSFYTEAQNSNKSDSELDAFAGLNEAKNSSNKRSDDMVQRAVHNMNDARDNNVNEIGLDEQEGSLQPASNRLSKFEKQRGEIIELWDACNVPLVHRTYFFLLFKGDPSDSVYMEVEFRRLSLLKDTFSHGASMVDKSGTLTKASSTKALDQERKMLCRKMHKFTKIQRKRLYQKWGIKLNSKQRSLQLAYRLWKDTKDMDHIWNSAALVASLVGFENPSQVCRSIFGVGFLSLKESHKSSIWKHSFPSLS
ncbi:kinesin-like protein KIN-7F [Juglans regia]|nr:kinesin-like protein KIN-7F [Juglans regia]